MMNQLLKKNQRKHAKNNNFISKYVKYNIKTY